MLRHRHEVKYMHLFSTLLCTSSFHGTTGDYDHTLTHTYLFHLYTSPVNHIPSVQYVLLSGRHMVLSDWCFCPVSKMPALYSEYVRYIEAEILALKLAAQAAAESKASEGKEEGKGGDNNGKRGNAPLADIQLHPSSITLSPIHLYPSTTIPHLVNRTMALDYFLWTTGLLSRWTTNRAVNHLHRIGSSARETR